MALFRRARAAETRDIEPVYTLANPATAGILGLGAGNFSGEWVSEASALTLSGFYRAVMLIAGTMASLPLKTYRTLPNNERERVASFLDNPAGPDSITPFEWVETVLLHAVLHGEAFLLHVYGGANQIVGLQPIHPCAVSVERDSSAPEGKRFKLTLVDGTQETVYADKLTHIVGPCTDGLRGLSLVTLARNSLGMGIAAERSAARMFSNGALVQGVFTPEPDEDLSAEDVESIQADLQTHLFGSDNANRIPIINRVLKFTPWTMTAKDAQFLESRSFQIEEISRWTGVPPHLLMQTEKQTSWGTGVAEQNKGLATFVLMPWAKRICARLSRLLPAPRFCEFDFAGLEAGSAQDEIALLLSQVNGGLLSVNEARRIRNLPPLPDGDEIRVPSGVMLMKQLMASGEVPANGDPAAIG